MPVSGLEFLKEAETHAKQGMDCPAFAVIFGDEPFLKSRVLAALLDRALGPNHRAKDADADMALCRLDGEAASAQVARVFDEARTLPFLAKRRVVVVEEADEFVTKARKELEKFVQYPPPTGVLILSLKSFPSNTTLAKLTEKIALAVDCRAPKEAEMPGLLIQLARKDHGLNLESDAARLMVELVGPELGLMVNELGKLAAYVGTAPTITRDDVAAMVGSGRVLEIWKVIDLATTGKAGEALDALDRLLAAGEPPIKLMAAMTTTLLKVAHAGRLRVARMTPEQAARAAGIPPFGVEKMVAQHAHLGPSRVARLSSLLLQTDLDLKGFSNLPPRTILERLIVELARPRKDLVAASTIAPSGAESTPRASSTARRRGNASASG